MKFSTLLLGLLFFSVLAVGQDSGFVFEGQTVNVKDSTGLRQGPWVVLGEMQDDTLYKAGQLVERGQYTNNRKTGLWFQYFPDGVLHSEVTWVNGRARGHYKEYWANGQLMEEGEWNRNKNTGDFKRWHENGVVMQEFHFNKSGKREGVQRYTNDKGILIIEGTWNAQGKKEGKLTRWTDSGELKSEEWYTPEGKMDVANTVFHDVKPNEIEYTVESIAVPEDVISTTETVVQMKAEDSPSEAAAAGQKPIVGTRKAHMVANGFNELKRKDGRPAQRGEFRNGRIYDGKVWVYDSNGLLERILIFRKGKAVGTEPIDDDDV